MVLTTNKSEANRFAKLLNTTAKRDIAASYTGDTKNSDIFRRFQEEELRILVVCGKLIEGYDRKQISVCAIVRKVSRKSKVCIYLSIDRLFSR
jgi:superfamily II DNA or RNA helicase